MTNPILIPFRAEHLLWLEDRDGLKRSSWEMAVNREKNGIAYTALVDDKIIACAGVVFPWPEMGSAWVTFQELALKHKIWVTRIIKRILEDTIRARNLNRVEAVVLADNIVNQEWIKVLGFTQENGRARKYSPDGRDVIRYEYIKE